MNTNKTPIVATRKGYALHEDGELWATGKEAYLCGNVSDPGNLDEAIDNFEEELRCLMADARAEFGV